MPKQNRVGVLESREIMCYIYYNRKLQMRKEWEHEKNRKTCIDSPDSSACDVRYFIYAGGIFCQSVDSA